MLQGSIRRRNSTVSHYHYFGYKTQDKTARIGECPEVSDYILRLRVVFAFKNWMKLLKIKKKTQKTGIFFDKHPPTGYVTYIVMFLASIFVFMTSKSRLMSRLMSG